MARISQRLVVFEFGYVGDEEQLKSPNKKIKPISKAAFGYLEHLCLSADEQSGFLRLCSVDNNKVIQLRNYAGVLFTPDGTQIEVLPKIGKKLSGEAGQLAARGSLLLMLAALGPFRHLKTHSANLAKQSMPLLEAFIGEFLQSVNALLKRGLHSDYVECQDNLLFLKGKLLVDQQIKRNAVNQHRFYVQYDEFLLDRPANRLLHSALKKVMTYSVSGQNQKLARELLFAFAEIPLSINVKNDFASLKVNRAMSHYQAPLDWARLILDGYSPLTLQGEHHAISLLFPMEAVFEAYVARVLKTQLNKAYSLATQVRTQYLAKHDNGDYANLRPDMLIKTKDKSIVVLDTKWKLISGKPAYGLKSSDFYQMFVYGHKYLPQSGDLILIYPSHDDFDKAIEACFDLGHDGYELKLWVVPFCLGVKTLPHERLKLPSALENQSIFGRLAEKV
jgi:5-methylcytosine-specific restriction enzyme subunit McrC